MQEVPCFVESLVQKDDGEGTSQKTRGGITNRQLSREETESCRLTGSGSVTVVGVPTKTEHYLHVTGERDVKNKMKSWTIGFFFVHM